MNRISPRQGSFSSSLHLSVKSVIEAELGCVRCGTKDKVKMAKDLNRVKRGTEDQTVMGGKRGEQESAKK